MSWCEDHTADLCRKEVSKDPLGGNATVSPDCLNLQVGIPIPSNPQEAPLAPGPS